MTMWPWTALQTFVVAIGRLRRSEKFPGTVESERYITNAVSTLAIRSITISGLLGRE